MAERIVPKSMNQKRIRRMFDYDPEGSRVRPLEGEDQSGTK